MKQLPPRTVGEGGGLLTMSTRHRAITKAVSQDENLLGLVI